MRDYDECRTFLNKISQKIDWFIKIVIDVYSKFLNYHKLMGNPKWHNYTDDIKELKRRIFCNLKYYTDILYW